MLNVWLIKWSSREQQQVHAFRPSFFYKILVTNQNSVKLNQNCFPKGRFFIFSEDRMISSHFIPSFLKLCVESISMTSVSSSALSISSCKYRNIVKIILMMPIHPCFMYIVSTKCICDRGTILPSKETIHPTINGVKLICLSSTWITLRLPYECKYHYIYISNTLAKYSIIDEQAQIHSIKLIEICIQTLSTEIFGYIAQ